MVFCTKCGAQVATDDSFCRKCGAPRTADVSIKADLSGNAVERDAKIRLKREHDKVVGSLGVGGGLAVIILTILVLVVADKMGRLPGGLFVGGVAFVSIALFVASFVSADFAESVNRAVSSKTEDPLTGKPMRMLWWFRWFTAMLGLFLFVGLSDYASPPDTSPQSSEGSEVGSAPISTPAVEEDAQSKLEEDYVNQIGQEAQEMSGSMDRWQKLMTAPRINDEDWRLGVTAEIANWTVIYHQALALKHPDRWSNVNDCWLDALQRMDLAGQDYGEGIDRVDAGQIYRANDEVAAAVEKEKECNDKIAQLKSELNFVPAPE